MRLRIAAAAALLMATSAAALELHAFKSGSWRDIQNATAGKPAIVHIWSLTCGTCLVELPEWGKFAAAHPGTRFVLINWDRKTDAPDKIAAALTNAGLGHVENWVLGDGFSDKLRFELDPNWLGEMPYTRLIGSAGGTADFSGTSDFEMIARWIASQPAANAVTSEP